MKTFKPTLENVKYLGRTLYLDNSLWLAPSASGVEFIFQGTELAVTILGDDYAVTGTEQARIAVYVDESRVIDDMVLTPEKTYTIIPAGQIAGADILPHCIRILKLTEAPMSVFGIRQILTDDNGMVSPAENRPLKLEFIGDSITCGYGVDDEDLSHAFSTRTEDVTRSYAYLCAKSLNADYSMVSYSGYGVYSGYTEGDERCTDELVPPYYPFVGFSRGTVNGKPITMTEWDFARYIPDLIVINLGTNDDSYCRDVKARQEEFSLYYQDFLRVVREKNPSSYLLCTYGVMNNRLLPYIEKAVSAHIAETADDRIGFLPLPMQTDQDGYVIDFHPSRATHIKIAGIASGRIREILRL